MFLIYNSIYIVWNTTELPLIKITTDIFYREKVNKYISVEGGDISSPYWSYLDTFYYFLWYLFGRGQDLFPMLCLF